MCSVEKLLDNGGDLIRYPSPTCKRGWGVPRTFIELQEGSVINDLILPSSSFPNPKIGNRYRLLKVLGQGSFGRTFLAVDESHPSKLRCTIKQFFPHPLGSNSEQAAELFRQEAERLRELGHHAQIPELLNYFEEDSNQYIVQEYIDGDDLEAVLVAEGPFSEDQICQLLYGLLPVLDFVHSHQVIHRDIKPQNIIRRHEDGRLFLVDFGAAKYATGTALAKTQTMIGTAAYIAPEQLMGKAVFVSDLYSLAVTCIHLLTQMEPFDLVDSYEGVWVWGDYLNQPVSNHLEQVLDKMLERSIRERYHSADKVLQALSSPPIDNSVITHYSSKELSDQAPLKPSLLERLIQVASNFGAVCVLGSVVFFGYQFVFHQSPSLFDQMAVIILENLNPALQPIATASFSLCQILYLGYLTRGIIVICERYQQNEDWMNEAYPFVLVLVTGTLLNIALSISLI